MLKIPVVVLGLITAVGASRGCEFDRARKHLDLNNKVSRVSTYFWAREFIGKIKAISNFERCCLCCNGGSGENLEGFGLRFYLECECDKNNKPSDCPNVKQHVQPAAAITTVKPTKRREETTTKPHLAPSTTTMAPAPTTTVDSLRECRNPSGDSCNWYSSCLHLFNPCSTNSSEEYALNYGHKYCSRYEQNINKFSPQAKLWIGKVRKRLQVALRYFVGDARLSCLDLQVNAFDSHTKCYVDSGFCSLPLSDYVQITKVVGNALIPFSGGAWLTAQNGGSTVVACATRYASALGDAFISTVNDLNQFVSRVNQLVG